MQRDRDLHGNGMRLPDIMHVELEAQVDLAHHCARGAHDRAHFLACRNHPPVEPGNVDAVERNIEGLHLIVPHIGDDATKRRRHAGKARHQRHLQTDLLDDRANVQRPAAAKRHADKFRGIVTALDRHQPDRTGHAGIGNAHDGLRGLQHVDAERMADMVL